MVFFKFIFTHGLISGNSIIILEIIMNVIVFIMQMTYFENLL